MNYSPLTEAASDLAQAAFDLIGQLTADSTHANVESAFVAIRRFYVVYHASVGPELPSDDADLIAGLPQARAPAPTRFSTAILTVEPGVFDPAVIARYILTACEEIEQEGGYPALDPAIRLMASQLSWLCQLLPNLRGAGGPMFDCTREVIEGE